MKKDIRKLEFPDAQVYVWENIQNVFQDEVELLLKSLPRWRQDKAHAINNMDVRKESVLSFALLQAALETEFGIKDELDVDYLEHGKPVLINRSGIYFNMSHCSKAVACVVGSRNVGVDIERRGRYNVTLAQHILNENELHGMVNAPDTDLAFTSLWTKKEALLKMTGDGVSSNIKDVLSGQARCGISTFIATEYVCSVAVSKESGTQFL